MSSKKTKYADIKKWADKRVKEGSAYKDLNAALGALEASDREILELKTTLKEKSALRKTARETLEATYKLAKVQAKQALVIKNKEARTAAMKKPVVPSLKKPEKTFLKKK